MMLIMIVSLYTSRVVLEVLGAKDFGIYSVVGGIVIMLGFLNSAMNGATQRFLSYEIGNGEESKLQEVFSVSINIHIFIASILLILAETVGLWFLNYELNIPSDRMVAANWVYQFSILSVIVNIISVPYTAMIISHEKMTVYAYISMLEVILRLGVVFLLMVVDLDKLSAYAILMFCTVLLVQSVYILYCKRKFIDSKYILICKSDKYKEILSFVGWDLYGNLSTVVRTQGVNILINIFFNPIVNAANGIAMQVQSAVMSFGSNAVMAIRPQVIKSYSSGDNKSMFSLILESSKYCYILLWTISLPLMIEMPFVLKVWLKDVPEYTAMFCVLTLIFNLFAVMSTVAVSGLHALGMIKRPSLINGTIYMSVIPISYVFFKLNYSVYVPFILNILFVFIGCSFNILSIKKYLSDFPAKIFFIRTLPACLFISLITFGISYYVHSLIDEGWGRLFSMIALSVIMNVALLYTVIISREMRLKVNDKIKKIWS